LNEKHTFEVTWSKYVDLLAFQGIAFICVCVSADFRGWVLFRRQMCSSGWLKQWAGARLHHVLPFWTQADTLIIWGVFSSRFCWGCSKWYEQFKNTQLKLHKQDFCLEFCEI